MISTIPVAVRALTSHMESLKRGRIEKPDDIAFWCLNILATSPTDYSAWATRHPYRSLIRCPRKKRTRNAKGRQALIDSIAVTIADLESGYRTTVDVYSLPRAHLRTLSDAHKAKLSKSGEAATPTRAGGGSHEAICCKWTTTRRGISRRFSGR